MCQLAINYDKKYDILYVDIPSSEPTYGSGGESGIVTFHGMESDTVLGFLVENFKERLLNHKINSQDLPIQVNIYDPIITALINGDGSTYKATITA